MNFIDTLRSVELVLAAGEVPLLVGETGIGKTSLAHQLAEKHGWTLINIDGNLLKEGEIGGLPTMACRRSKPTCDATTRDRPSKKRRRSTPSIISCGPLTKSSPAAAPYCCLSTKSTAASTPCSRN